MKTLTTFIWGLILILSGGWLIHLAIDTERQLWDRILKCCIGLLLLWKAYDKIENSTY